MENKDLINIIKNVASENNYEIVGLEKKFQIYIDRWHAVAFEIQENSSGYIQVHQWEGNENSNNYGRAVYSLRNVSDTIQFCTIMITSAQIRARRLENT